MLVGSISLRNSLRDRGCSAHPVFPAPSDVHGARAIGALRAPCVAGIHFAVIVRAGGRSSIPETPMIESISLSVLVTPHTRGMTAMVAGNTCCAGRRVGNPR